MYSFKGALCPLHRHQSFAYAFTFQQPAAASPAPHDLPIMACRSRQLAQLGSSCFCLLIDRCACVHASVLLLLLLSFLVRSFLLLLVRMRRRPCRTPCCWLWWWWWSCVSSRYDGHAFSRRAIDRIFSEIPMKFNSPVRGKMGYEDFIWFLINDEDKTTDRSLEYWFRLVDLDGDGCIRAHEMSYFYEEQSQRLECLNHETVPFEDILCQMSVGCQS